MRNSFGYDTVVTFFTSFVFCGLIVFGIQSIEVAENQGKARQLLNAGAASIVSSLDTYIGVTDFWEVLIKSNNGDVKDFEKISKGLMSKNTCIKSILIAPGGIVKYVYPLEGNERSLVNLLADPNKKNEAEHAIRTGEITLTGPTPLYQGGDGLIIRNPVFFGNKDDTSSFWGFTEVIIKIPDYLREDISLSYLAEDFDYRLWRSDPSSGKTKVILETKDDLYLKNPVSLSFEVPNAHWTLSLEPKRGWVNINSLIIEISFSVIVSILIACISRYKGMVDNIMIKMGLGKK